MGERFFIRHNTLEVYNTSPLFIFILASHTRAASGAFTILTQQLYTQDTGSFGADSDSRLHRHHSTPLHPPYPSYAPACRPASACTHGSLSLVMVGVYVAATDPVGMSSPKFPTRDRVATDKEEGASFPLLCPAQAHPPPRTRYAVTFTTQGHFTLFFPFLSSPECCVEE